jgi:serine/threonine-protein kinase
MAYVPGSAKLTFNRTLVWVDRHGEEQPLNQAARGFNYPRISPDGQQLAVSISDSGVGYQIWTLELTRGTLSRLTFEGITNSRPVWSPDGGRIFFVSNRGGPATFDIFSKRVDGSGPAEQLTSGTYRVPSSLSSDGKMLIFQEERTLFGSDIGMLRLEGEHEPELLLDTPFSAHSGKLSPDDRWLAYVSNESGREEIYLRPFPGLRARVQVSTEGGTEPMWSRNGSELFYRNGDQHMAVSVSTDPELALGKPSLLFEGQYETSRRDLSESNYDVAPEGRFIMLRRDETAESSEIVVVTNWFEELKRLVPKD